MVTQTVAREDISSPGVAAPAQVSDSGSAWVHGTRAMEQRAAQQAWANLSFPARLRILGRARHDLASRPDEVAATISPRLARTHADTLVAELLPLLEAIRFLERDAARVLRSRAPGRTGLPFWLRGVETEIHRVPFGRVLVIGPSNYPLLLPGVQTFQALAAGNAVIWKPGDGGAPIAHLVAESLFQSGLPRELLQVTDDTREAAQGAIASGVDKVFFTGSATAGRLLLHQLADTTTPSVMELSGNDAVIVLPSADLDRVAAALSFGMRLNGSATCMAPRRVLLVDCTADRRQLFLERLQTALTAVPPVDVSPRIHLELQRLIKAAERDGASVLGDAAAERMQPVVLLGCSPEMEVAQADLFAPVLLVIEVQGSAGALRAQMACPLALTTSIFGEERAARKLSAEIHTGTVIVNDLIVPTADPRVPFGGRRGSGFGVTRGAEGLLEMTAVKVVSVRRGRSKRHYEPTGAAHIGLFSSIIAASHAGSFAQRLGGLKRAFFAAKEWNKK